MPSDVLGGYLLASRGRRWRSPACAPSERRWPARRVRAGAGCSRAQSAALGVALAPCAPGCHSGSACRRARLDVRGAAEDEQQVREAVEVADDLGVGLLADGDRAPLGAPADGAADVQLRRCGRAAGDHERAQRLELGVDLVAALLEPLGVLGAPRAGARGSPPSVAARAPTGRRRRRAGRSARARSHSANCSGRPGASSATPIVRVQLVDRAVGLHARMQLGDAAHVAEVGLAAVAELGVDAGQVDRHRVADAREPSL